MNYTFLPDTLLLLSFLMIRPERRGNAIVSFMKASVAKCIREQPDIIQAQPVGIEGGAVYMKHASQTGELILMSLRPWRDIERRKSRQIMIGNEIGRAHV